MPQILFCDGDVIDHAKLEMARLVTKQDVGAGFKLYRKRAGLPGIESSISLTTSSALSSTSFSGSL